MGDCKIGVIHRDGKSEWKFVKHFGILRRGATEVLSIIIISINSWKDSVGRRPGVGAQEAPCLPLARLSTPYHRHFYPQNRVRPVSMVSLVAAAANQTDTLTQVSDRTI